MFEQATDPGVMQILGCRRAAQQCCDLRIIQEAANKPLQKRIGKTVYEGVELCPQLVNGEGSMRLEIRQRILLDRSLTKLLDGELGAPVPTGNFNLRFHHIASFEGVGTGLEVIPHPGFALSCPVGQTQRQVSSSVTLAAELLLGDSEKLRDRLPFMFGDIAEEDGFSMRGNHRGLTHERELMAVAAGWGPERRSAEEPSRCLLAAHCRRAQGRCPG